MIRRNLTNLRWNLTIRWRLSGGEWYPFRGVPDDVVQRWAVIRPNMREDQVDAVLKARDELSARVNRWVPTPADARTTALEDALRQLLEVAEGWAAMVDNEYSTSDEDQCVDAPELAAARKLLAKD